MAIIEQTTYSALRFGGASPARACAELGVNPGRGPALEALFHVRRPGGDSMRPRFARHEAHLRALRAAGGFVALRR
jgi:hypothetical protein